VTTKTDTIETKNPALYSKVQELVDEVLSDIGNDIRMGLPIGVGKPTILANEIYKRAKENPKIKLKIFSGLSLCVPQGKSDLEKRFLGPLVARLFPDYPDPEFTKDSFKGKLPDNVEISDFYITPGAYVGNRFVQQGYISSNYSHVTRDVIDAGVNVAASMVCRKHIDGQEMYSLSSNADAPLDTVWKLQEMRRTVGKKVAIIGQVNQNLPFMYGTAASTPDNFDYILDNNDYYHQLFGTPREAINTTDYMIGINASTLIKDGGSIQIGIGSLGDAITIGLVMRQKENAQYREFIDKAGISERFGASIDKIGGLGTFEKGLYGITELMVDGFIQLIRNDIIKRKVYDNSYLQKLVAQDRITDKVTPRTLELLMEEGAICPQLHEEDVVFLKDFGILRPDVRLENGQLLNGDGSGVRADLSDGAAMDAISAKFLGDRLQKGILVHASFFVGPPTFYQALRDMSEEERWRIQMREISFCNTLRGDEQLKLAQRLDARFVNVALMQTLLGNTVSDGLENGQVISGVGGQFDFVSMAHGLPGGRSIILLRSTKQQKDSLTSNIRWNYGHCTVPRHMRDFVVTEYGVADLRGMPDRKVIANLINIADSRFQNELLAKAKENQKIPDNYKIPQVYRQNYPERLEKELKPFREKGLFKPFPFGSQFTDDEIIIGKALQSLKSTMETKKFKMPPMGQIKSIMTPPREAMRLLERLDLDKPKNGKEKITQKLVLYALAQTGAI